VPYVPNLDKLLVSGSRYSDDQAEYVIEAHDAPDVTMPTGQVVGCDALTTGGWAEPFTVSVPAGTYPLRAWVAVLYTGGAEWQRRVAALQLVVTGEPAARWEMALVSGQDPSTLGDGEFYGYGVDAGTGTLADVVALRALADWDYERLDDVYIPAQYPLAPVPGGIISAVTDEPSGANVVAVSSGWGDGAYPTFIGYTAEGAVASFVTDFMVVPAAG
jgi:hypothetical protein